MEADQEESKEPPRLKINRSKRDDLPRSLSAADGNKTSKIVSPSITDYV